MSADRYSSVAVTTSPGLAVITSGSVRSALDGEKATVVSLRTSVSPRTIRTRTRSNWMPAASYSALAKVAAGEKVGMIGTRAPRPPDGLVRSEQVANGARRATPAMARASFRKVKAGTGRGDRQILYGARPGA